MEPYEFYIYKKTKYLNGEMSKADKDKKQKLDEIYKAEQLQLIEWNNSLDGKNSKRLYEQFHPTIEILINHLDNFLNDDKIVQQIKSYKLSDKYIWLFNIFIEALKYNRNDFSNISRKLKKNEINMEELGVRYDNIIKRIHKSVRYESIYQYDSIQFIVLNYYLLRHLYNYLIKSHDNFILYGATYLSIFKSDDLNIFLFGESHRSNICNIPTNSIYIYIHYLNKSLNIILKIRKMRYIFS